MPSRQQRRLQRRPAVSAAGRRLGRAGLNHEGAAHGPGGRPRRFPYAPPAPTRAFKGKARTAFPTHRDCQLPVSLLLVCYTYKFHIKTCLS